MRFFLWRDSNRRTSKQWVLPVFVSYQKGTAMTKNEKRTWTPVAKLDQIPDSPIRTSTAYRWHHVKKFPEAFQKVGGKLFVDIDTLWNLGEVRR
jgi:hypothetical protein